jgi:hypothetical protein
MNCQQCGGALVPSDSFCGDCGTSVGVRKEVSVDQRAVNVMVPEPRETRAPSSFASAPDGSDAAVGLDVAPPPATLPGTSIRLSDGEQIWKVYRAVRLRSRRRGQGTIFVTNLRVVFHAWTKGMSSRLSSELIEQVNLEDINGFSAYVSRRVSLLLMLLAAVFSIATLVTLVTFLIPLTILFLILAGVCIAALFTDSAQRGSAGVVIHARHTGESAVVFGGLGGRNPLADAFLNVALFLAFPPLLLLRLIFRSYTVFDVKRGRPDVDSDAVIAEFGALILDIQTRGDYAAPHWGVQLNGNQLPARGVS